MKMFPMKKCLIVILDICSSLFVGKIQDKIWKTFCMYDDYRLLKAPSNDY